MNGKVKLFKRIFVFGLMVFLTGCAEEMKKDTVPQGSTLTLNAVAPDIAFNAAEKVVAETYQIDSINCTRHQLVTLPLEYTARDNSGAIGDLLVPSNRTFRNTVSLAVTPTANNGSIVSVRVDVQRRDTTAAQSFAYLRENDDRPANSSAFQNTGYSDNYQRRDVWTSVRRDYNEEQFLLTAIKKCITPKQP